MGYKRAEQGAGPNSRGESGLKLAIAMPRGKSAISEVGDV